MPFGMTAPSSEGAKAFGFVHTLRKKILDKRTALWFNTNYRINR